MARGRTRKIAERTPSGQISRAGVPKFMAGNDRVMDRRAAFSVFQGGKADQQVHDPIGRAWAAGLLDGHPFDAAILRDAGRDYAELYWMYWPATPGIGSYEPRGHSSRAPVASDEDRKGERFNALDGLARSAGRDAYAALHAMCVSTHWFPDDNPEWLDRLINGVRQARHLPVAGGLPRNGDGAMLERAVSGLLAMVGGRKR